MECFAHAAVPASGICKTCSKGVCRSCAVDIGFALACSEACAKEATELNDMTQRGKKLYGIGSTQRKLPSGVVMWLLFGSLFTGFGVYTTVRTGQPEWFLLLFGFASFFVAWIAYRRTKELGLQC